MSVKVSIVLPVFNVAPYLDKCMASVCNQTLTDIEIIAVNDASPDNSLDILKKWQQKDSRIHVLTHKNNRGAAGARQTGLDAAKGQYVAFVDPDDFVDTDFFEKLYNLAISENADIAKGAVIEVGLDGIKRKTNDNLNQIISKDKYKYHGECLWNAIYNKKMCTDNNIHFVIDIFCFGLQAAYFANKIAVRNDAFYNYVRHENSCDSQYFSIEKWQKWNVNGANYYLDLINKLDYPKSAYIDIATNFIFPLYFYGYNKLETKDINAGVSILARNLIQFLQNCKFHKEIVANLGKYGLLIENANYRKLRFQLILRNRNLRPLKKLFFIFLKK